MHVPDANNDTETQTTTVYSRRSVFAIRFVIGPRRHDGYGVQQLQQQQQPRAAIKVARLARSRSRRTATHTMIPMPNHRVRRPIG